MPRRRRGLHLLAAGVLGPVPQALAAVADDLDTRALCDWLAKGRRAPGGTDPDLLCPSLGLPTAPAPGPTALLGAGGEAGADYVYRAAPCHLRADRDRVLLYAGADATPTEQEATALVDLFNGLFAPEGRRLEVHAGDWSLRPATPLPVDPPGIDRVSGRYLDEFLPEGSGGADWRAFVTEVQMLFHTSTVSREREERGAPVINGLWIWGGGDLPDAVDLAAERACSDDPYLRGLARLGGVVPEPGVARLSQLGAAGDIVLADWNDAEIARRGGDTTGWLAALEAFDHAWAREGWAGLRNSTWQELCLHAGACAHALRAGDRHRFWRRSRALSHAIVRG